MHPFFDVMINRKTKIIATRVVVVALFVSLLWIGIFIGRRGEQRRTLGALRELYIEVDRNREHLQKFNEDKLAFEELMSGNDKMMQTIASIRNYYVDPIALDTIYEKAIPKLLQELDPHSEYIPARYFSQVNESLEGEFDGIGIVFNAMTDTITVLNVIPQGPSDKAGIRAGDRIMQIDGRAVAGQKIPQDSM